MRIRLLLIIASLLFKNTYCAKIDSLKKVLLSASKNDQAALLTDIGYQYLHTNSDSALTYTKRALSLSKAIGNIELQAHGLNNLGTIYYGGGEYSKALNNYIEAEKLFTQVNNENGITLAIMNIGIVYEVQGIYDKALKQYEQAISASRNAANKDYEAQAYSHLGSLYYSQNDKEKSLEYFQQALKINQQINNIARIMECLNNIAVIYQEMGRYPEALQNFSTDLAYARRMNIKSDVMAILHNIGLVHKDKKDYPAATAYVDSALAIAKELRDFNNLREAYASLSEIYQEQHNYPAALRMFQLSAAAKDSLLSQTRQKQFIEMSTKYETEKKEAENKLLKSESEKQRTVLIAITGGFVLMLSLAFLIYKGYRQKKKANQLLEAQNLEIKAQKHIIEEKQTEILDSITYAKRLQDAILPPEQLVKAHLPQSFIFYQPKDIVAGDFYWMEVIPKDYNRQEEIVLIAAADCTGHGVPGALVSVVCSNAMNRALHEFHLSDPGQVLDKARELVLETFSKSDKNVKDGMDISLAAIELPAAQTASAPAPAPANSSAAASAAQLRWAGANNPVYIISNGRLSEIKGNKFPVGAYVEDMLQHFQTRQMKLEKGDRIYLFSDGFADQFGGPANKKYKYRRLKEKLLESHKLPMEEQKAFMQKDLEEWRFWKDENGNRRNNEQVDDILLIGIQI